MTTTAVEDLVAATLQDIKKYGAILALSAIVPMSYRTLYRHAEDDPEGRPVLGGKTLRVLSGLFAELGILEGYDRAAMLAAIAEIERRAATRSAEAAASIGVASLAELPREEPDSTGEGGDATEEEAK